MDISKSLCNVIVYLQSSDVVDTSRSPSRCKAGLGVTLLRAFEMAAFVTYLAAAHGQNSVWKSQPSHTHAITSKGVDQKI